MISLRSLGPQGVRFSRPGRASQATRRRRQNDRRAPRDAGSSGVGTVERRSCGWSEATSDSLAARRSEGISTASVRFRRISGREVSQSWGLIAHLTPAGLAHLGTWYLAPRRIDARPGLGESIVLGADTKYQDGRGLRSQMAISPHSCETSRPDPPKPSRSKCPPSGGRPMNPRWPPTIRTIFVLYCPDARLPASRGARRSFCLRRRVRRLHSAR